MKLRSWFCLWFCLASLPWLRAHLELPALVGDNMVLQRDGPIPVWGWAAPGETVRISFRGRQYRCTAAADGRWQTQLAAEPAGGPYTMTISADETRTLQNILLGDVWLCSGQSNMGLLLTAIPARYDADVTEADGPRLRLFTEPSRLGFNGPKERGNGHWVVAAPDTVRHFSAVAYFFGKALERRYHVPIGLIHASQGGSHIEAWISAEGLKPFPQYFGKIDRYADPALVTAINARESAAAAAWHQRIEAGDTDYSHGAPRGDSAPWREADMPGPWTRFGRHHINGVFWVRRTFEVPPELAGNPAIVDLGLIEDEDRTFVNGTLVGTTNNPYEVRYYRVPAHVLKPGKNEIVLRVINAGDDGGFVPGFPCVLHVGPEDISLEGHWLGLGTTHGDAKPSRTAFRNQPAALYNGMIAPLTRAAIKGVIWYQGEGNAGNPREYRSLFPALINDWRRQFGQGDFPFLFVQLPNYHQPQPEPSEGSWAELREAQAMALALPHTGMAVTLGLGEWNNLHPPRKKEVGERLALAAERVAYQEDVPYSGPLFKGAHFAGAHVRVTFDLCGSKCLSTSGHLTVRGFALAGADRKFVWAQAEIDGATVDVWSDAVPHPVAVRYAWANNPATANLVNAEGLPAAPFRTDDVAPPNAERH